MADPFDIVSAIGEILVSWRFYLCATPAIIIAVTIGMNMENQDLAWIISVPLLIAGVGGGFYWELKAHK